MSGDLGHDAEAQAEAEAGVAAAAEAEAEAGAEDSASAVQGPRAQPSPQRETPPDFRVLGR